jgi:hypothetical protein
MKTIITELKSSIRLAANYTRSCSFLRHTMVCTIIAASFFSFASCSSQKQMSGSYNNKTECLGLGLDGSQTLKVWGNGQNKHEAIEQAKKNAIRDVLFNGIYAGNQECEKRPIVAEVNAQQKHELYFNNFFSDKGDYKIFVSVNGDVQNFKGANKSVTYNIVVLVHRADLKQRMVEDGVLK